MQQLGGGRWPVSAMASWLDFEKSSSLNFLLVFRDHGALGEHDMKSGTPMTVFCIVSNRTKPLPHWAQGLIINAGRKGTRDKDLILVK